MNEFKEKDLEQSVSMRFEEQAKAFSERLALKTKTRQFTYLQLNQSANRAARVISERLGDATEPVVLLLQNRATMILGILGALKARKIATPLDLSHPPARIRHILEDSQARLVVTDQGSLALAKELISDAQSLLNMDAMDSKLSSEDLNLPITPDTPAYIIYTSGSTGEPKGVVRNHRTLLNGVRQWVNYFHVGVGDRILLLSSPVFGASVWDTFAALLTGAALFPFNLQKEGFAQLGEFLVQEEITIYHSAPTIFRHFAATLNEQQQFPKLRLIQLGGEAILKKDVALYKKHFSRGCLLRVGLASAEAGAISYYLINKDTPMTSPVAPVGYALEGNEVFLVDEAGHDVGFNSIGEILVKSRYLSSGYWRKPELTAAVFESVPGDDGVRIFHTGDLGRLNPDGMLEHLGRKDFQVKIRGQRVETSEVEMALLDLEAIANAVVVARADQRGDNYLVAYIVPKRAPAPSASELSAFLLEQLPGYMVPAAYVTLDALPWTANGKLDRAALPAPETVGQVGKREIVPPRNTTEARLVAMWKELLRIQPIGVRDNFFDLGGDSLAVVCLFADIERVFGKRIPAAAILDAPTIEQLSQILQQEGWSPPWSSLVAIQPGGSKPPFYCVHEIDGNVFYGNDLARHLGPDQPLYGLRAHGLDGKTELHSRIEDMAAHYIREIRELQPAGPYYLGGSSLGGLVAFEMAQQLHALGQSVGLLALFDTYSRGYQELRSLSLRHRVSRHTEKLAELGLGARVLYVLDRAKPRLDPLHWGNEARKKVGQWWKELRCRYHERAGRPLPSDLASFRLPQVMRRARASYVPKPYRGRIVFFQPCKRPTRYYHDPRLDKDAIAAAEFLLGPELDARWEYFYKLGWTALAEGGLEVIQVNGEHGTLVREPDVQSLGVKLKACLQAAYEQNGMPHT